MTRVLLIVAVESCGIGKGKDFFNICQVFRMYTLYHCFQFSEFDFEEMDLKVVL